MEELSRRISPWAVMFYLGMAMILVWALLKSVGVINTPVWLEVGIPAVGAVLGLFGIFRELLNSIHQVKLDVIVLRKDTEKDISLLQAGIQTLRTDFARLEKKLS